MAKKTADLSAQIEEIFERAKTDTLALLGDRAPAEQEPTPAAEETATLPDLETIQEMSKEDMIELAGKLNIEVEGRKTSEVRSLLETVHNVVSGNTDDVEEDAINALAEAVSIAPAKKVAVTIEKLKEYFEKDADGTGTEGADADADEDKGKKGKKPAAEEPEEEEEEVKLPKVVLKAELPEESEMKERLEAHNEAQEDDDKKITGDFDDTEELEGAYRKLLALMVDDEGELAEWGTPYVKDELAHCCGLPTEDTEIKGDDRELTRCIVTRVLFTQDKSGALVPAKKAAKK